MMGLISRFGGMCFSGPICNQYGKHHGTTSQWITQLTLGKLTPCAVLSPGFKTPTIIL